MTFNPFLWENGIKFDFQPFSWEVFYFLNYKLTAWKFIFNLRWLLDSLWFWGIGFDKWLMAVWKIIGKIKYYVIIYSIPIWFWLRGTLLTHKLLGSNVASVSNSMQSSISSYFLTKFLKMLDVMYSKHVPQIF